MELSELQECLHYEISQKPLSDREGSAGARGFVNWLKALNVRSCCHKQVTIKYAWINQAPSNTLTMVFKEKIYVSNCRRQGQVV
jgi:hypothetical protein